MLVSSNMTQKKNGSEGRGKKLFKKKFLPHILFNDSFVSHSTTKKQRWKIRKKKKKFFDPVVYICKVKLLKYRPDVSKEKIILDILRHCATVFDGTPAGQTSL